MAAKARRPHHPQSPSRIGARRYTPGQLFLSPPGTLHHPRSPNSGLVPADLHGRSHRRPGRLRSLPHRGTRIVTGRGDPVLRKADAAGSASVGGARQVPPTRDQRRVDLTGGPGRPLPNSSCERVAPGVNGGSGVQSFRGLSENLPNRVPEVDAKRASLRSQPGAGPSRADRAGPCPCFVTPWRAVTGMGQPGSHRNRCESQTIHGTWRTRPDRSVRLSIPLVAAITSPYRERQPAGKRDTGF